MDINRSRGLGLAAFCNRFSNLFSAFHINVAFRAHSAKDSGANSHIGFFVGNEDGRADGVVTAASRVRPINAYDNRNTELVQFQHCGRKAYHRHGGSDKPFPVRPKLNARAIQDIDKRDAQGLCRVRSTEQAFGLARYPGTGKLYCQKQR